MVYIVGIGPGSKQYILPKAIDTLKNCDIILGFDRALKSLDFIKINTLPVKNLKDILNFLSKYKNKTVAIVASGDPCFYGITDYIQRNYNDDIQIVPGISSFQYLVSKINLCWQNSYLGSLHGRKDNFIEKVKNYKITIWLTDKKNTPNFLCENLIKNNIKATIYVGENLSYEDEKITKGNAEDIVNTLFSNLSVVVIQNNTI